MNCKITHNFILFSLFYLTSSLQQTSLNIPEIPVVSESKATCPCSQDQNNQCRSGHYIDHYYNPPYSGYPANSSYLPPVDSVPEIVERLTSIRDVVKEFVVGVNGEDSDAKKAIYVKNNFSKVNYILAAINKAANKTHPIE